MYIRLNWNRDSKCFEKFIVLHCKNLQCKNELTHNSCHMASKSHARTWNCWVVWTEMVYRPRQELFLNLLVPKKLRFLCMRIQMFLGDLCITHLLEANRIYSDVLTFLRVRRNGLISGVGLPILLIAEHEHLLRSFCYKAKQYDALQTNIQHERNNQETYISAS